jgi:hypothetical protein
MERERGVAVEQCYFGIPPQGIVSDGRAAAMTGGSLRRIRARRRGIDWDADRDGKCDGRTAP